MQIDKMKIKVEKQSGKFPFSIWLSRQQRWLRKDHILYKYHEFLNYFLAFVQGTRNYSCPSETTAS